MRKLIGMVVIMTAASVVLQTSASVSVSLEAVFKAFRKVEIQIQTYTEPDVFDRMVGDIRQKISALKQIDKEDKCLIHLQRALMAYDIINEIWQAQEHDSTVDAGWACIPLERYEFWLKSFPSLLTWQWGNSGIGVSTVHEAFFASFQCCIILKPFLDDVWAPCLFHEARREISLAAKCFNRVN